MTTRIQIKRGTVDPTGLTAGEFAYNVETSRLFLGNTASQKWIGGEVTGGVDMGGGSAASESRVPTQRGVYEYTRNSFVGSVNGATGAVTDVARTVVANTFTPLQTFGGGLSGSTAVLRTVTIPTQQPNTAVARIQIGSYGTISETAGGAAYITGNNVAASNIGSNNLIVKTASDLDTGQFLRMRYDQGISIHTGVSGSIGTTFSDDVNQRLRVDINGNVLIGSGNNSGFTLDVLGTARITGLGTFTSGISAAGGITFNGSLSGTTAAFTGNVGIGAGATAAYRLFVNGAFAATTKSFVIPHPTESGKSLRYGSLEGPENGVYVRGCSRSNVVFLPPYWRGLVDESSITVNITPVGGKQDLWVAAVDTEKVVVYGSDTPSFYYTVYAERKDVPRLEVEF